MGAYMPKAIVDGTWANERRESVPTVQEWHGEVQVGADHVGEAMPKRSLKEIETSLGVMGGSLPLVGAPFIASGGLVRV